MIRGTVYCAGSMNAREQCAFRAFNLMSRGFRVVSTWHARNEDGQSLAEIGSQDMLEVLRATHVVVNADTPSSSGGYWTEMGLALALGKDVTVIGGEKNVFAHVPGVRRFATWDAYLDALDREMASMR